MSLYRARPNIVNGFRITHISDHLIGHHVITLDTGEVRTLTFAETARMKPAVGDYLVRTIVPDVYEYINPKNVFETKYDLVDETVENPVAGLQQPIVPAIGLLGGTLATPAEPSTSEVAPVNTNSGTEVNPTAPLQAAPATDEEPAI